MSKKTFKVISYGGLVTILFTILSYYIVGSFLLFKKQVKSPYIILEGWISNADIQNASHYFLNNEIDSVFVFSMRKKKNISKIEDIDKTNKLKKNNNKYSIYWGGTLAFEIPSEKINETFNLKIKMRGTANKKVFPHYKIFVNNNLIKTGFVNNKDSVYEFTISQQKVTHLTYLSINFDNDHSDNYGDRNLFVSDISIDLKSIDSIAKTNFFRPNNIKPNISFITEFSNITNYLTDLGFDSSKVKLIEIEESSINRTLGIAKGAKEYFKNTEIKTANIITANNHSMRSYLNFKNTLRNTVEIGCIPSGNNLKEKPLINKIDERVSLLFTWIYWVFN